MKRVAYLCEFSSINGGENSLLSFLQSTPSVIEPVFLCPPDGPLTQRLQSLGYAQHDFRVFAEDGNRKSAEAVSAELCTLINRIDVDIVHANSLSMSRVLGRITESITKPTIGHIRDILKVSGKVLLDLTQLDMCLAVSDATRACYLQQGLSKNKIATVYNGIDASLFLAGTAPTSSCLRQDLKLAEKSVVIGGVGQLGLRKGWEVLLDAVELLGAGFLDRLNVHVVLAGLRHSEKQESIEFEQRLRGRSQNGMLKGRLHLVGYWSPISEFLLNINLLAHPAYQEPLGRVLLEAAASSTPVVATDVGGTREIFGEQGAVLVPSGNAEVMADGLRDIIENQPLAKKRAVHARQRVDSKFGIELHKAQILRYYDALLQID